MRKVRISINDKSYKFKELIAFVRERSDAISVVRYYDGYIAQDEFEHMQDEYKKYIYKEDKERRDRYLSDSEWLKNIFHWIKTDYEAEQYFNDLLKQDLEGFFSIKYEDYKDKEDIRFKTSSKEFIKRAYTRITPVTCNPVFEMNYFMMGAITDAIINNMQDLYDFPYMINGYEFEDLTFYKEGEIMLTICSHENYASLELGIEEYKIVKKLNIVEAG